MLHGARLTEGGAGEVYSYLDNAHKKSTNLKGGLSLDLEKKKKQILVSLSFSYLSWSF